MNVTTQASRHLGRRLWRAKARKLANGHDMSNQKGRTPADRVELILHGGDAVVRIGEPVNPQLQAKNESAERVLLSPNFVFDADDLAFAEPNSVHLLGPDGADLALPYKRDASYFAGRKPLALESGKEEWQYLPIYAHFHLRRLGRYRFWLDLADESGGSHRSNERSFELRDVEYSMPPDALALKLMPATGSERMEVDAVFTNTQAKPVVVLAPQEDSFDGWVNPIYQFTIRDAAGRILPPARRSGTMASPRYDDSNRIVVGAGESHRQRLRLPDLPRMRHNGEVRVQLTYIVRSKRVGKAGSIIDEPMNWDASVFVGRVESNEITVKVL
jgi:hypothetical protein